MSGEPGIDEMVDMAEEGMAEEFKALMESAGTQQESEGQGNKPPETEPEEETKKPDEQEVNEEKPAQADEEEKPTTGDDKEAATSEPVKGELPENLKPFDKLIESKGFGDVTTPEGVEKVLKNYQDLEKFNGQRSLEVGLTNDRVKDITSTILSSPEDINKFRESQGLPAIKFDSKSVDDKLKDHSELTNHILQAFNGKDAEGSFTQQGIDSQNWLNNWMSSKNEDLRFEKRDFDRNANVKAPDTSGDAKNNLGNLQAAHKDENIPDVLDNLFKNNPSADALFASFGVSPSEALSSMDRANAFYELAKHVERSKNIDALVKEGVTKQLEAHRERGNASTPGINSKNSGSATENQAPVNDKGEIQTSKEEFAFLSDGVTF